MLEDVLKTLGLDDDEIKTYLTLLEVGKPVTVGTLAKHMGVPRPSLYGFLKRLHGRGLVSQSTNMSDIRTFFAVAPEQVSLIIDQKIGDLLKTQNLYKTLLPELQSNQETELITPRFQLFEGEEGVKHVLKDMLLYHDIETQAFWPIKSMLEVLGPDFFRYHNKERIKNNLSTRAIWPPSQVVDIKDHPYLGVGKSFKREIRVAPKEIDFSMGYWIYGNKVAFISSRKESFGFIIESAELVEMLRTQFEVLWKASKPIKVDPKDTNLFLQELEKA